MGEYDGAYFPFFLAPFFFATRPYPLHPGPAGVVRAGPPDIVRATVGQPRDGVKGKMQDAGSWSADLPHILWIGAVPDRFGAWVSTFDTPGVGC